MSEPTCSIGAQVVAHDPVRRTAIVRVFGHGLVIDREFPLGDRADEPTKLRARIARWWLNGEGHRSQVERARAQYPLALVG